MKMVGFQQKMRGSILRKEYDIALKSGRQKQNANFCKGENSNE